MRKAKQRIDQLLVKVGLAEDTAKAQALVMAGQVIVNDQRVQFPSQTFLASDQIRLKNVSRFVSRGGEKLAGALADFGLYAVVQGCTALDIGSSTGGFSDCLLQGGAAKVYAVDVGTNQLAWKLRSDPRVVVLEQTDVHNLKPEQVLGVNFVVADISFQSLARVIPVITALCPTPGTHFLLLVKPQFELPREKVPEGGVVADRALQTQAVTAVQEVLAQQGLQGEVKPSQIKGRSGNQEFFIYFLRI